MEFVQVVRSTPGQYISEKGALASLAGILKNFERPYIITGEKSYVMTTQPAMKIWTAWQS